MAADEKRERLATELCVAVNRSALIWPYNAVDFILTTRAEREGALAEAMTHALRHLDHAPPRPSFAEAFLSAALAAHAALDAPPEPTLVEAVEAFMNVAPVGGVKDMRERYEFGLAWDALRAALSRAKGVKP